ncbi:MAG: hypothetical protein ABI768_10215 [Acidobacteriota bacterium]
MTPPVVKQGVTARCWAACMESWSYMVGDWPNKTQDVFVQQYGSTNGALEAGSSKFLAFGDAYDLDTQFFNPGKLTAAVVSDLLEGGSGYFMFIEQQSPGISHARLAYAVSRGYIGAMEPASNRGNYLWGRPEALKRTMVLV